MARVDSSPKAIIKAAVRAKCHILVRRYPHQKLSTLHGSNVKWLVLGDELFREVCNDFTIKKLGLDITEMRALFDADWVPQVTYELITKPSRPRRRRSQQNLSPRSASHSLEPSEPRVDSPNLSPVTQQFPHRSVESGPSAGTGYYHAYGPPYGSPYGPPGPGDNGPFEAPQHLSVMQSTEGPNPSLARSASASTVTSRASRRSWADTVLIS